MRYTTYMYSRRGFTIVEVLVGSAIIAFFIAAIISSYTFYLQISPTNVRNIQATLLAQEGVEAVKLIRNEDWSTNIDPLSNSTTYYLDFVSGAWTLTTSANTIDSMFTRIVEFNAVNRDGNDDIAASGTNDDGTRELIVTVSWDSGAESKSISTYITNILEDV